MTSWLFDTLVWTAALIALVLVLRRPVARMFGPHLAYALWLLPMLRLLFPPITLPAWMAPVKPEIATPAAEVMIFSSVKGFILIFVLCLMFFWMSLRILIIQWI